MRGLTAIERRVLEPIGEPGDYSPPNIIDALIEQGRAHWVLEDDYYVLEPTELGYLALRLPPIEGYE